MEKGIGSGKFFCSWKYKFAFNMQAVCNNKYRFLAVWIWNPASASDFIAFLASDLYQMLKSAEFLAPGLALYGDNAYVSNEFMVSPYWYVSVPAHNNFNFFQSQLWITFEQTFCTLVHRWGILH